MRFAVPSACARTPYNESIAVTWYVRDESKCSNEGLHQKGTIVTHKRVFILLHSTVHKKTTKERTNKNLPKISPTNGTLSASPPPENDATYTSELV